jgi:LysM repeat protein
MARTLSFRLMTFAAIAGLALLASACSLFEGDEEGDAGSARVRGIALTSDLDANGNPINPRIVFAPTVREIRATVAMQGVAPGMRIRGTWFQLGPASAGSEGAEVDSGEVLLTDESVQDDGQSQITFILASGSAGFPEDAWLLRIYTNGELVRTAGFVVARTAGATGGTTTPAPSPTPVAYTVVSGDTLQSIAQRFLPQNESIAAFTTRLAQLNNLAVTAALTPGQTIRIPPPNP